MLNNFAPISSLVQECSSITVTYTAHSLKMSSGLGYSGNTSATSDASQAYHSSNGNVVGAYDPPGPATSADHVKAGVIHIVGVLQ